MRIKRRVLELGLKEHAEVPVTIGEKTFVYDLTVEPVRDASGAIIGLAGATHDVTQRVQAVATARQAQLRLQNLSHRLLEIQEAERRQIARDLHDEIGQALTASKISLQSLQRYPEPVRMTERLEENIDIIERALSQVRSLSLELRPALLDNLGLDAALRWLVDQHTHRTGLLLTFRTTALDERYDPTVETACFRVAQEALNNVVRHAGAQHATVELQVREDGLHLRVSDDGAGFDVPAARLAAVQGTSFGLLGMEERATLSGGGIEWHSTPGQGTEVHAWFPLPVRVSDEMPVTV